MQPIAVRIVLWQLLVGLIGAGLWAIGGLDAALAALVGGVASALFSLQFAVRMFARGSEASPAELLGAMYRAEGFKLLMAAVLFIVAAKFFGHVFVPLVTTYMATLLVFWVALLWKFD